MGSCVASEVFYALGSMSSVVLEDIEVFGSTDGNCRQFDVVFYPPRPRDQLFVTFIFISTQN